MIDLNKYYRHKVYIDSATGKDNTAYCLVQKKGKGFKIVENIYDVENDKFVLDEWVDSAGGGLINGDEVNLRKVKHNNSMTHPIDCLYNKVNVKNGELSYDEWLTGDEWIHGLQKRDIKA